MLLKQSTVYNRPFLMVQSADHITGLTSASVSVSCSKAGAAFVAASGSVTEIGFGWYYIALTTGDTGTLGALALHCTATSADPTDVADQVVANILGDTLPANVTQIDGNATNGNNATLNLKQLNIVNSGGDAIVASATGSNGNGVNASGNGSGSGIKGTGGATGHGLAAFGGVTSGQGIRAAAVGTDAGFICAGGTNGNGFRAIGNGTAAGAHFIGGTEGFICEGVGIGSGFKMQGGNTNGPGFQANGGTGGPGGQFIGSSNIGLSLAGGTFGMFCQAGSGSGNPGAKIIGDGAASGFVVEGGATGNGLSLKGGATSGNGLNITTVSGHGINVAPVGTDKHGILTTGGNGGTSDGFKAVAGTGGVDFRANITGNITGNLSGTIGDLAAGAQADVKTQVVAALATDTYAEPGQGTPASTNTLAAKIGYIMKAWLNKSTQTASEYDLYNSAGAVVDQKATVSDDGTTFTRGNVVSGP